MRKLQENKMKYYGKIMEKDIIYQADSFEEIRDIASSELFASSYLDDFYENFDLESEIKGSILTLISNDEKIEVSKIVEAMISYEQEEFNYWIDSGFLDDRDSFIYICTDIKEEDLTEEDFDDAETFFIDDFYEPIFFKESIKETIEDLIDVLNKQVIGEKDLDNIATKIIKKIEKNFPITLIYDLNSSKSTTTKYLEFMIDTINGVEVDNYEAENRMNFRFSNHGVPRNSGSARRKSNDELGIDLEIALSDRDDYYFEQGYPFIKPDDGVEFYEATDLKEIEDNLYNLIKDYLFYILD